MVAKGGITGSKGVGPNFDASFFGQVKLLLIGYDNILLLLLYIASFFISAMTIRLGGFLFGSCELETLLA